MNHIKSLRNFGTIYLWIFVVEVLQVCAESGQYHLDTDTAGVTGADTAAAAAVAPALLMKPYKYRKFDDYTDDLLHGQNAVATKPLWQTWDKYFYYKHLPLLTAKGKTLLGSNNDGNSMTSEEITFKNLNDFVGYKIKNAIWPKRQSRQRQQQNEVNTKGYNNRDMQQGRHSLQQFMSLADVMKGEEGGQDNDRTDIVLTNFRYKQNGFLPIIMAKHLKAKDTTTGTTKKTQNPYSEDNINLKLNEDVDDDDDDNDNDNDDGRGNEAEDVKENLFPLKNDNTYKRNDAAGEDNGDERSQSDFKNGITNSNGNGNENVNYAADNNILNTNYLMAHRTDYDRDRDQYILKNLKHLFKKGIIAGNPYTKRAKSSIVHPPFLPAVSGGAMTNLGKFFRDLSKNVHVSEQYQWNADEQKLLEGDPNFGNIEHHLTKPNAATDQQTSEWIKAIRFYRPSQKIRSLVAMNPHGQWDHSSQFIDPNYMWVGLGK